MDPASNHWYAKIEDSLYGPVSLHTLQHWAADGSLNAAAEISESEEGPWIHAGQLEGLDLDWQLLSPDGESYFPCHILALREEIRSENIDTAWQVKHLPSNQVYPVVDALCSALLEQNHILENHLTRTLSRLHDLQDLGPASSTQQHTPTPDDPTAPEANWTESMLAKDQSERDAEKWKHFYEEEIERNEKREADLLNQIEELRSWQRNAAERIKALERRRAQLEKAALLPTADNVEGEDRDLRRAYQELRLQLDHLTESLNLSNQRIETARAEAREAEQQLRRERQLRDEEVGRQKELQIETSQQLTRLEQAHLDLTRSYRELNDRLIRQRNQMEAPNRLPLNRSSDAPPPSDNSKPADTGAPLPKAGKMKIKLT